jgi:hypothetical protein
MSTIAVVVAFGILELEHYQAWATQIVAQVTEVIIIAITCYAHSGCWRVARSWQGAPPTWVSAHRLKTARDCGHAGWPTARKHQLAVGSPAAWRAGAHQPLRQCLGNAPVAGPVPRSALAACNRVVPIR